jgi:hypothetical protein
LGVAVVLAIVIFINSQGQRLKLAERMVAWRIEVEEKRQSRGLQLLNWDWVRATQGSRSAGPVFDPKLEEWNEKRVDIVGFMTPIGSFRNMKEFILLPMPIECYFCERPPMRDQVLINMAEGETTNLYEDPMIINGVLKLQRGQDVKKFYVIDDARIGPGDPESTGPKVRILDPEHMVPQTHTDTELQQGIEPPTPGVINLEEIEQSLRGESGN